VSSDNLYEAVLAGFDQEEQQGQVVEEGASSFIGSLDTDLYREREREYRDIEKHWVRRNAWLDTAKKLAGHKSKGQKLRYLTLPAYYRIDVSLLVQEGLIEIVQSAANNQAEEVYVAAFESDPGKYGRMIGQTPKFKLFARSQLETVLIDPTNDDYEQLRNLFPFDIVNFDLTTSLTPDHEGPYSRTMRAIETIFTRQAGMCPTWAFFLTIRNMPENWQPATVERLHSNLQDNLSKYPKVLESYSNRYNVSTVAELARNDPQTCISQSVVKWLVDRGHEHKFKLDSLKCYKYTRKPEKHAPYDIYKYVFVFSEGQIHKVSVPMKAIPMQSWMEEDLVSCVSKHQYKDVDKEIEYLRLNRPTAINNLERDIRFLCHKIDP